MANPALTLPTSLPIEPAAWESANKEVLWCWKRDSGRRQRTIFFSGRLRQCTSTTLELVDWNFFYHHRAESNAIDNLYELVRNLGENGLFAPPRHGRDHDDAYKILRLSSKALNADATETIYRLQRRRPRKQIPKGDFPVPSHKRFKIADYAPVTVYAGSGVSYECGLPTLAEIHARFGVDNQHENRLVFGEEDPIPKALHSDAVRLLCSFCDFHLAAATAVPSYSHRKIAELFSAGLVGKVLTDNVDNVFSKCKVPFTRTRTVFPGRRLCSLGRGARTLLVIGIAADRRQIICRARNAGMNVVVVNPYEAVSPGAQNLSYLRRADVWYHCAARHFFETLLDAGG